MQLQPITDWQAYVAAGRQYLQTACRGRCRPTVFNNELVFQLAAMAIEKFVVGLSQYHRQMPIDHTLSGLVVDLAGVCPVDTTLVDRIKQIEAMDDMCRLADEHRQPPGDGEIHEILAIGRGVERFVDLHVVKDSAAATG